MHELSIIKTVMRIVDAEMRKSRLKRLKRLKIRVGALSTADSEALRFAFEEHLRSTPSEGAALDIIEAPLSAICSDCDREFEAAGFHGECPYCRGTNIEREALEIISMEALP